MVSKFKQYKWWLVCVGVVIGLIVGRVAMHRLQPTTPAYEAMKRTVLLSDRVDKLTDSEKTAFYTLARRAAKVATRDEPTADWARFKDTRLYVEKTSKQHEYLLNYTVEAQSPFRVQVTYQLKLTLSEPTLMAGKVPFKLRAFRLLQLD
ncbi:hypothetical protein [Lacticaseibacillus absianus]|uniref:hypothetical protein n=1 Tax=Lacticaseibacillus absianus TaxID=2729623 RepID=UPI0015C6A262|nr:hypothetical protein [Lacticaseibacillus absianus]